MVGGFEPVCKPVFSEGVPSDFQFGLFDFVRFDSAPQAHKANIFCCRFAAAAGRGRASIPTKQCPLSVMTGAVC